MRPMLPQVALRVWPLFIGSIVMACSAAVPSAGSDAPSQAAAASPSTVAADARPSNGGASPPSASPEPTQSTFTSEIYGYSVAVPGGWSPIAATTRWDGISGVSSDSPEVDRWTSSGTAGAWGSAAPYTKDLKSYTTKTIADTYKYHGQYCTTPPDTQDEITVGGERGTLISWNCGILINIAATVNDGIGYTFGFRDPAVAAATDPTDRGIFLGLLGSVGFPG